MNLEKTDILFDNLEQDKIAGYKDYWEGIKPQSSEEVFRRWLFAFLSIHTTWELNVKAYQETKDLAWLENKDLLKSKLVKSRCGLHNNRTNYIWDFSQKFWINPSKYSKLPDNWDTFRDSLVLDLIGIGIAKVSFALEMIFPLECKVLCMDTHILRLYGMSKLTFGSKKNINDYKNAEKYWINRSQEREVPSPMVRHYYWDKLQGFSDTRYWSFVFEK